VSDRAVGQAAAALDPEARLEAQNQAAVQLEQGREPRQPELRRTERPAQIEAPLNDLSRRFDKLREYRMKLSRPGNKRSYINRLFLGGVE
jgi:hypothetical protein